MQGLYAVQGKKGVMESVCLSERLITGFGICDRPFID